ncbi:DUF222 domain-containing protein [Demequina aurantiaca]|uniref:HNH endonuclease n=1 Tax=Demequina aurantiaca TaxID=676200 RepID=UPI003D354666
MTTSTALLQRDTAAACGVIGTSGDAEVSLTELDSTRLLDALAAFGKVRREVDAVLAQLSGEIGRRSAPDAGAGSLAKKSGVATPDALIANATGGSRAEGRRLVEAGVAAASTSPVPDSIDNTANPNSADPNPPSDDADPSTPAINSQPRLKYLSKALSAGELSIEASHIITSMLTRTEDVADPALWVEAERRMVERAPSLSLENFSRFVRQLEAQLDHRSVEETEEALKNDRYLTLTEDRGGAIAIRGRLDPETAAPIKAAVDALVAADLHRSRGNDRASEDRRQPGQMRADALAAICRHALGCENTAPTLAKTTVVVRLSLGDLQSGDGVAAIDGLSQPVSVSTARRMAADAEIIPMVLGGDSEILDFGRVMRLFSPAQRLALGERDGGCAWCGAPPSFTEAHHIRWWVRDSGPTDLDNGLLLCVSCHHRIHRDDWEISILHGDVWFTPPASVDPQRRPRIGGRKHFDAPRLGESLPA